MSMRVRGSLASGVAIKGEKRRAWVLMEHGTYRA